MSESSDEFRKIGYKESCAFFEKYHYIGKGLVCPVHYGFFKNGILVSCASLGYLPSPKIPMTVWNKGCNGNTLELRRLSSIDTEKNAESKFISRCLRALRKDYPKIKIIFSYADEKAGHLGIIYQASNFKYVGIRSGKTEYLFDTLTKKWLHSRTVGRWKKTNPKRYAFVSKEKRQDSFKKHLYVWVNASKMEKDRIFSEIRHLFKPYPKREDS